MISSVAASDTNSTDNQAVSAADTVTVDDVSGSENNEVLKSINNDSAEETLSVESNNDKLRVSSIDVTTYDGLYNAINNYGEINIKNNLTVTKALKTISTNNLVINGNGYTINGASTSFSQLFYVTSSNVIIKNINIINFYGNKYSAIEFSSTGSYGSVLNSTFYNCYMNGDGGAIKISSQHVTVENCSFNSCMAKNHAAAIQSLAYYTNIINCNFTNCRNTNYEATLNMDGSSGNYLISGCIFKNNKAGRWNGALRLLSSGTITNCIFENNTAGSLTSSERTSGAIGFYNDLTVSITNCIFINNHGGRGGAILNDQDATMSVDNCSFINNTATYEGGAIYVMSTKASTIINSKFTSNTANEGAGVYFNAQNSKIYNCNFNLNKATSNGGAIYFNAANSVLNNSDFTNNSAKIGGAVYSNASGSIVDSCRFKNCTATSSCNYFYQGSTITFINTYFPEVYVGNDNTGGDSLDPNSLGKFSTAMALVETGGTMYVVGEITSFTAKDINRKITIKGYNSASAFNLNGWNHRAFNIVGDDVIIDSLTFKNSQITGNGGVLNITSNNVEVNNCNFTNNKASNGGAIYISGENSGIVSIDNCIFKANNATDTVGYGGAVYISYTNNTMIFNSQFINNEAYLGAALCYWDVVTYYYDEQCTFTGNVGRCSDATLNTKYGVIYDEYAIQCIMDVYLNSNGSSSGTGTKEDPVNNLKSALERVAPRGTIHCMVDGDSFSTNSHVELNLGKFSVKFIGNNTIVNGFSLHVVKLAYSFEIYNVTFNNTSDTALKIDSIDCIVGDCVFTNNNAVNGAGIYCDASGLSLVNCNFTNNTATYQGGAIHLSINADNTNIKDCNFTDNQAYIAGAVLYFAKGSISGCNFKHNIASYVGGAAILNSNVTVSNSNFTDNIAHVAGGAISIANANGNLTFIDCNFTSNQAIGSNTVAGAIYLYGGSLNVSNCDFTSNNAEINGGAIFITKYAANMQISGSNFTGNNATSGNGGAIWIESENCTIVDSVFDLNKATSGACISIGSSNNVISKCNFTNNHAESLGGAVFTGTSSMNTHIEHCIFTNNTSNNGGAIRGNGNLSVDGSTFTNNYAEYGGGAITFNNDGNIVSACNFTGNNATELGGALVLSANCIVFNSNFTGNNAKFGGAIYVIGNNPTITGCEFKENKAVNGSAIYIKDTVTSATITDSTFTNNNATEHGTVYLKGITIPLKLSNNIFTGNSPVGAVENYYEKPTITTASVIYVNSTGGGSGLTWDDPTSWDDALIHLENPGKIVLVSDVTIDAQTFTNQNVTIISYGDIRRKLSSNGKYIFTLENSNLVLKNVTLDAGVTVGSGSSLSMDNVTFTAANGNMGISFASGSIGSITNSHFINSKNIGHALIVDGTVNINNTVFANNTLAGSALYYGENGSGSVTYSTFTNNTAANVRNINITDISQVTVKDNTIDAILKDINISRDVYGEDLTINGTFDAGVNFQISGITLTLNDTLTTNRTVTVKDTTFTTTTIDGGVLGADTYNVTADSSKSANNYVLSYSANEFTINKANIAADVINGVEVTYGNGTITIKGKFNQTGTHVNYTGQVVVSITGVNGTAVNNSVQVSDGEFTAVIVDGGLLGAGKYNVTVVPNSNSDNQNYTVGLKSFANYVTVKKADIQANWTADAEVIYGMNNTITVVGTFNASSGANAKNYTGIVTITISNGVYSIENTTVEVKNGRFTAVLTDQGRLGHGTYNVSVSPNSQSVNANYTVSTKIFENKVNVQKASVNASDLDDIEAVVYAINDTITVVGTFNASAYANEGYAKNYTGPVSVTISNGVYSIVNTTVEVKNGKFTAVLTDQGQLGYGTYNVIVSNNGNSDNENYTVTTATFNNVFTVNKATVSANESSKALDLVYGVNDTITITGTFNASAHDNIGYNGNVTVIISGNNGQITLNNVKVENGEFRAVLTDQGRLGAGDYNITVNNGTSAENYTVGENIFKNHVKITPRTVEILEVGDITVVYGNNQTVKVVGKVNTTRYGANYTGLLNVSIKKGDTVFKNNNTVYVESDGTFSVSIDVSNLGVSEYDILVEGQDTSNYTVKEAVVKILNVTQANITINDISEIVVVYGRNNVAVSGNITSNIIAGLGANYTGSIVITIEGTSHTYKIDSVDLSGKFSYTFDLTSNPLNQGNYSITVNVTGNDNYSQVNRTFIEKLNVLKANVTINQITVLPVVYGNNRTVNVTGSVTSDILFGTAYNGNVTIMIEGNKYSHAVNSDGTFSFLVPIEYALGNGTYDVNVTVDGNGNYNGKEKIFGNALSVNPADLTINHRITVSEVIYWDTFVDIAGNVVSNINHTYGVNYTGKIIVSIDDTDYSNATTDVNDYGAFSVRIYFDNSLNAGTYNITVKVNDDSSNANYTSDEYTFENNLTVKPRTINITDVGSIEIVYGNNKTVNVVGKVDTTEHGENYTGLLNVSIMINNQVYRFNNTVNAKSDGTFSVSIDVDDFGVGNYAVLVEGGKTNNYVVNFNNTAKLNVTKAKVIINDIKDIEVIYGNDNVAVSGNITSNIGADLGANYTGSIVITIDGTSYTHKIDSVDENGVFSYTFDLTESALNYGDYNITVNVTGNGNYSQINRTFIQRLCVLKANVTINQITVLPVVYGNNRTVNVTGSLTSDILFGNNYDSNVTVVIEGNKYSHSVNSDGTFTFLIPIASTLGNGNYDVNVTVEGNDNYNSKERIFDNNLTVNPADLTINHTIAVSDVIYWDTFVDIAGNVVSNINQTYGVNYTGKITVFIDDTAYSNATTVVKPDGTFSVRIYFNNSLNAGSYNITVKVNDDDNNANYTSDEYTFEDNLTVKPRTINISDVGSIEIVYGNNKTVNVVGKVDTTRYGDNYTGLLNVSVMINGQVYRFNNTVNAKSDGTFSVSIDVDSLDVGNYTILVEGAKTNNYVVNSNNTAKLHVTQANVTINEITLDKIVYGTDQSVVVYGTLTNNIEYGINYTGDVFVSINGYDISNTTNVYENGSFVATLRFDVLAAGSYTLNVTVQGDTNYKANNKTFADNLTILRANVTAGFDGAHVIYGMNNTIVISGSVSKAEHGVRYNGTVCVVIGQKTYKDINVVDGKFNVTVLINDYGAGNYTTKITETTKNDNYTFEKVEFVFEENVIVDVANVTVTFEGANVTYGDNSEITIKGYVSNSTYGVAYSGKVNVTIGNRHYNEIKVEDGVFNVTISDIADYDAGMYNVSVVEAEINSNYTFYPKTFKFKDNVTVNKRTIEIISINDITVVYGNNNTVYVTGKVNTTRNGVNYTGIITAVIKDKNGNVYTGSVNAGNGEFSVPVDITGIATGEYIINVTGAKNSNYTAITANTDANLNVARANVTISEITAQKFIYGINNTVVITGTITNGIIAELGNNYTDYINITIDGTEYFQNKVNVSKDGSFKFEITLSDSYINCGNYHLTVTVEGDDNYNKTTTTSIEALKIEKATISIISLDNITVLYGVNDTIHIIGKLDTVTYGTNYDGNITVTIRYLDGSVVSGNASVSNGIFDVIINGVQYWNVSTYVINVTGEETTNFNAIGENTDARFTVNKSQFTIDASVVGVSEGNVKVDQNATVTVTGISDYATGNVTITVTDAKGKEYIIDVPAESSTYLDVIDTLGTYTVTAQYMGDNNYNASNIVTQTFTVTKWNATDLENLINGAIDQGNTTLTLEHDYEFGDDQSVPVNINASITIEGNGHTIDANGTEGIFNITTNGVTIEDITLIGVEDGKVITSTGNNTKITNVNLTNNTGTGIEIKSDNSTLVNVAVSDSTGTAVEVIGDKNSIDNVYANNYAGTVVKVVGDNNTVNGAEGDNVTGTIVSINGDNNNVTNTVATAGNSTVVDVAGGNNNTVSNITSSGNAGKDLVDNGINTRKSGISPGSSDSVFDLSKANANPAVFSIKLPTDATGTFTVTVSGKNYTTEVKKGTATIKVSGLSSGSKDVVIYYSGDTQYKGLNKTSTITVPTPTKQGTVLTFAKKKYTFKKSKRSKTKTFKATLKTKAGVKLAGKTVLLKLTKVNKIKLSAKAKKAIKNAKAKVNRAKKAYKKSKTTKTKKALDKAKKALTKAKKPQTMLKQLKKGTYAVKTNKNGLVKLTLSKKSFNMKKFKGKVKLTATFKGDSSYLKSSKTVNIVIK